MSCSRIKLFEINKLFNQYNVKLPFDNDVNIFLGENGMGKTTILNCLYFVLSGKVEKLKTVVFDKVKLSFDDGCSFEISYNDVISYVEDYMEDSSYRKRRIKVESIFSIKEIDELWSIYSNYQDDPALEKYYFKLSDTFGMPRRYAEEELRRFVFSRYNVRKGNFNNVISFKKNIQEKITDQVLYFPTYRRIEEDLSKLGIEVEKNDIKNKLIQFGMTDVEFEISNLLVNIKSVAITGFTQMTGILLKQYLEGNLPLDTKYRIDKSKLSIALDRIGDEIEFVDKQKIKDLVNTDKIYNQDNIYLLNLIKNLIISYEKQNQYDEKVKNFASTCNNYLNGKKYLYDESNVKLDIYRQKSKKPISIQNLSSGEKQVISMFSKLYLENNEKSIILFDEPELSLSIKWQSSFLPDIMKSNKCSMLIAVTHSPFIFDNEFDCLAKNMNDCLNEVTEESTI